MTITRLLRIIPGLFILLSLALGIPGSPVFVSEWWLAFTAFFIIALMMSLLVFIGEAVRDAFDPRKTLR